MKTSLSLSLVSKSLSNKQINNLRRERLNLLILQQSYLVRKIQLSQPRTWNDNFAELTKVQSQIQTWYRDVAAKIQLQSRVDEFQLHEQTRIYHHELHSKHLKK